MDSGTPIPRTVDELTAALADATNALKLIEFGSCDGCGAGRYCLWCSQQDDVNCKPGEHLDGCPVAAVLAAPPRSST